MAKHQKAGRSQSSSARSYPRTARLKKLFLEILADAVEEIDDSRLELVTLIEVDVDPDLAWAKVYFLAPKVDEADDSEEAIKAAEEALYENRIRLQAAIANEARVRRTPELSFEPDRVTESAARIEDILRSLPELQGDDDSDEETDSESGDGEA